MTYAENMRANVVGMAVGVFYARLALMGQSFPDAMLDFAGRLIFTLVVAEIFIRVGRYLNGYRIVRREVSR
jgi:hypothetical protein